MATDKRTSARKPLTVHQQEVARVGQSTARSRKKWENSAAGIERLVSADQFEDKPIGMVYHQRGWSEAKQAETSHPTMYDRQLPGLEDPDALKTPERWEDIHPDKQADIQRRVLARSGATLKSMEHAFGSHLDQAYYRAEAARAERKDPADNSGQVRPAGQDFYTSGEPLQIIRRTAAEHGVSHQLVTAMQADNSPQTPFQQKSRATGETVYPQDEMVRSALSQVQKGVLPSQARRPPGSMGYTTNFTKSVRRAHKVLWEGSSVGDAGSASPKTGPFSNSSLRSEPDFFVADTYSGGAGHLPHLSNYHPVRHDESGVPIRQPEYRDHSDEELEAVKASGVKSVYARAKSEREEGLGTKGIHSMIDFASRNALQARGLGSLRQGQAAQWNEARMQDRRQSYEAPPPRVGRTELPGQGGLF